MEAVFLKEIFNIKWVSQAGLVENIDQIVNEYKKSRGLLVKKFPLCLFYKDIVCLMYLQVFAINVFTTHVVRTQVYPWLISCRKVWNMFIKVTPFFYKMKFSNIIKIVLRYFKSCLLTIALNWFNNRFYFWSEINFINKYLFVLFVSASQNLYTWTSWSREDLYCRKTLQIL